MRKATRSPSAPSAAAGGGRRPPSEELVEFCRGLRPILLQGDVDAFRRYLRRWEDLVGDTADLGETPDPQARRTMDALLRRPAQFGLPPWPDGTPPGARFVEDAALPAADTVVAAPVAPVVAAPTVPAVSPDPGLTVEPSAGDEPPSIAEPEGIYQVDMLSGELVPLDPRAIGASQRVREATPPSRAPRRRRRPPPAGLEQLPLWPTA